MTAADTTKKGAHVCIINGVSKITATELRTITKCRRSTARRAEVRIWCSVTSVHRWFDRLFYFRSCRLNWTCAILANIPTFLFSWSVRYLLSRWRDDARLYVVVLYSNAVRVHLIYCDPLHTHTQFTFEKYRTVSVCWLLRWCQLCRLLSPSPHKLL